MILRGKNIKIASSAIIPETVVIHDDVTIEDNVVIHDYVVLYPKVTIKKKAEIYDFCVIGKLPTPAKAVSRPTLKDYHPVIIGEETVLCPHATIYTDVIIGNGTLLGDGASIREECRIGDNCIISRFVTVNYHTFIGNRTKIMDLTHITGNCFVGDDVFIGMLVSTANDNNLASRKYEEENTKGPVISNKSTIGTGSILLPAISIGEGSIVGAGAVVTKDVETNSLVMGVPAKFVKLIDNTPK